MMIKQITCSFLLILLVLPICGFAADIYVQKGESLQTAIDNANANDVIFLNATFNETISIDKPLILDGQANTLFGSREVIFTGDDPPSPYSENYTFPRSCNVYVSSLDVSYGFISSLYGHTIEILTDNVTIRNLTLNMSRHYGGDSLIHSDGYDNLVFEYLTLTDSCHGITVLRGNNTIIRNIHSTDDIPRSFYLKYYDIIDVIDSYGSLYSDQSNVSIVNLSATDWQGSTERRGLEIHGAIRSATLLEFSNQVLFSANGMERINIDEIVLTNSDDLANFNITTNLISQIIDLEPVENINNTNVSIRFDFDCNALSVAKVDLNTLKIIHNHDGVWEELTTVLDLDNCYAEANVTQFSYFALQGDIIEEPEPIPPAPNPPAPQQSSSVSSSSGSSGGSIVCKKDGQQCTRNTQCCDKSCYDGLCQEEPKPKLPKEDPVISEIDEPIEKTEIDHAIEAGLFDGKSFELYDVKDFTEPKNTKVKTFLGATFILFGLVLYGGKRVWSKREKKK